MTRPRRHLTLIVLGLFGAVLLTPTAASATQRYASVIGAGAMCTSAVPCDLPTAVNFAAEGDEVIVAPGTYTVGSTALLAPPHSSVHGIEGQAKPLIVSSAIPALNNTGAGVTFQDLRVEGISSSFGVEIGGAGSVADRIESNSAGIRGCTVRDGATLRNSICVSAGSGGAGVKMSTVGDATAYVRNVTAIGTNPSSFGVLLQVGSSTDEQTVDLRGVIASGVSKDLAITNSSGGTARITAFYSNWDTSGVIVGTGTITPPGSVTNQTDAPAFVNAAGGNYHEAAGSPTIDAGAGDGRTGPLDVDGEARTQGATADIGADEFTVFTPTTTPATTPPADTASASPQGTPPPQTTIGRKPKKRTPSRNATFTFTSSEPGSTFSCALDGKRPVACTSPFKLKKLKPGLHKLSVAARNASGAPDPSPASYSWTVKRKSKKKA